MEEEVFEYQLMLLSEYKVLIFIQNIQKAINSCVAMRHFSTNMKSASISVEIQQYLR